MKQREAGTGMFIAFFLCGLSALFFVWAAFAVQEDEWGMAGVTAFIGMALGLMGFLVFVAADDAQHSKGRNNL